MANESALLDDPVEVVDEAPSLRDVIEDAVSEQETEQTAVEPAPIPAPAAEAPVVPPSTDPAQAAPAVAPVPPATPAATPQAPVSTELKAPAQWKPEVREHWKSLPLPVQQEILRRESDSMRLIGSVGPKIKMADDIRAHLEPFRESLQANGVAFPAFVNEIFSSVKSLKDGSPQEKAEVVANIVQSYGVDLKTLDAILTRRITAPPEVVEARRMQAQARAIIDQQQGAQQYQTALEAERSVAAFGADPKHEFIDDVRDMMADLIELGRVKTLDDAYHAAIWAHPDTRKILLAREAQSRATTKQSRANAARKASSSVHGAPATGRAAPNGAAGAEMSLRESLEQAFDDAAPL